MSGYCPHPTGTRPATEVQEQAARLSAEALHASDLRVEVRACAALPLPVDWRPHPLEDTLGAGQVQPAWESLTRTTRCTDKGSGSETPLPLKTHSASPALAPAQERYAYV